jgi:hypothetical protein
MRKIIAKDTVEMKINYDLSDKYYDILIGKGGW